MKPKRILMGLGFAEIDFDRLVEKLSGGYRMRVALAHLLLTNPDVLHAGRTDQPSWINPPSAGLSNSSWTRR